MRFASIAGSAMLLLAAGCSDERPPGPMVSVTLFHAGKCGAKIAGKPLPPFESRAFGASFQKLAPDKSSSFLALGDHEDVKSCVQQFTDQLGRLGYRGHVAFLSEPPKGMVVRE